MDIKNTYALGGGIVGNVLNKKICYMVDGPHTICTYNEVMKGQQDGLWQGDEATHELVAERPHGRVRRMDFGEETT